ncbi:MAG: ABC transporter ATP-binding protein [Kiloniellaceae bacterium]
MLSVAGLSVFYGRAQVLFGLSLRAAEGEVVALLGRNGAGKSTTLKAIMNLIPASAGEITYAGRAIGGLPANEIARLGIGYVPEDRRIFTELTVQENLEVGCQPARAGIPAWAPERLFALFPNLAELRHRRGGEISGGEQQMLALARTLMGNPRLLLLDEPSEGLAPIIVEQMARGIAGLKAEGLTVLLCEQNPRFALGVADRAAVIEKGRIKYRGTMTELMAKEPLRHGYLVP